MKLKSRKERDAFAALPAYKQRKAKKNEGADYMLGFGIKTVSITWMRPLDW